MTKTAAECWDIAAKASDKLAKACTAAGPEYVEGSWGPIVRAMGRENTARQAAWIAGSRLGIRLWAAEEAASRPDSPAQTIAELTAAWAEVRMAVAAERRAVAAQEMARLALDARWAQMAKTRATAGNPRVTT